MADIFRLIGQYFLLMQKVFSRPDKRAVFFKRTIMETDKLVLSSIPIVCIISVFIGAVITLQMAYNLENPILPKTLIGYAARDTMLLEFSSTIIALILAGKVGSNIASEIGTMRITEQIDALEMMGVNSASYLILPKVIASVLFNPFLSMLSSIVGLLGGWIIVAITSVITIADYTSGIQMYFNPFYFTYGVIKMAVFSILITTIPAFYGYTVSGGSLDVGRNSTKGIVTTSICILIFNLLLTQILLT